MRVIGFTGTRNGLTYRQGVALHENVYRLFDVFDGDIGLAIHGDCVGADSDFDKAMNDIGIKTRCLPCTFESMRANCCEAIAEPKPPMQRNRDIVAMADVMFACPPNKERIKKGSGTWATIGFTEKAGKPLCIIYPDGETEYQRW